MSASRQKKYPYSCWLRKVWHKKISSLTTFQSNTEQPIGTETNGAFETKMLIHTTWIVISLTHLTPEYFCILL